MTTKSGPRDRLVGLLRQFHLFAPVHMAVLVALGPLLARALPASASCEADMVGIARLTALLLYEVLAVPPLTLAAGLAARRRFRDPSARRVGTAALVLTMLVLAGADAYAVLAYFRQDPRVREFTVTVLKCAFAGR